MTATVLHPHGQTKPRPVADLEPNPKRIRGFIADRMVVDSIDSLLVWEFPYYPQWYFPAGDIQAELRPTGDTRDDGDLGVATLYDLVVDGSTVSAAAWNYLQSPQEELRDRVRIDFASIDRWLEEDVEVTVHPRSPYVRVDVLPSSRQLTVKVDGVVVADSNRASILYETGLPPRFYLPLDDVKDGLLSPTDTSSACPYKGVARYWDVTVNGVRHPDLVWGYDNPLPESAGVKGQVCFYNEKVELILDGDPLVQPKTKFS